MFRAFETVGLPFAPMATKPAAPDLKAAIQRAWADAKARKWSKTYFAVDVLGLESMQTLTNWLARGMPGAELPRVARALGWSIPQLLGEEPLPDRGVAHAIRKEAALDPYALIEQGLAALVIVGKEKSKILGAIRDAAAESEEMQAAILTSIKTKGKS